MFIDNKKTMILDEKALDPERGPFGRADMYGPFIEIAKKFNEPIGDGYYTIIHPKGTAYIAAADIDKVHEKLPYLIFDTNNTCTITTEICPCRQVIASVLLWAIYDIPFRCYDLVWIGYLTGLLKAWIM